MSGKKSLFLRADRSAWVFAFLLIAVFGVMLCGNLLTDKFADDFTYVFSFADGTRVQTLSGLLASMRAHYNTFNGRVAAHTFVHIFENLPKPIFDVINAGMFTLGLALVYTLCNGKEKRSSTMLLGLFAAIWIYTPAFGQVYFWLDGACNYLWAQVFALLFLLPYVRLYENRRIFLESGHTVRQILFALYAFPMGAYLENMSGAALFMAILLLLLIRFEQKRTISYFAVLPIMTGIMGYAFMIFSPGEQKNKNTSMSVMRLLAQAAKVTDRLHAIWVVIAALVVLFFVAAALHIDRKRLLLAGVFTCGGAGAALIFAPAQYFPQRCVSASMLLLTIACGLLLRPLLDAKKTKRAALCLITLLTLSLCYWCPNGIKDIYLVHTAETENQQLIAQQKADGITVIQVPIPTPQTKYSALDGLTYLAEGDTQSIFDINMAKYYGVDAILGVEQ